MITLVRMCLSVSRVIIDEKSTKNTFVQKIRARAIRMCDKMKRQSTWMSSFRVKMLMHVHDSCFDRPYSKKNMFARENC
jgi:hypothetical protein